MATLKVENIPAITEEILAKLKTKGFQRVADFVSAEPARITAVSGLPHKKVLAIRRLLLSQFSSFPVNGKDLYEEYLNTTSVLATSSSQLNELLSSGIYTGEVTEIVGASSTGKTQLCMSWACNVAMTYEKNVIYIDSSGSTSPRRLADIIKNNQSEKTFSLSNLLSRICITSCFDYEELKSLLLKLQKDIQSKEDPFMSSLKAIVIDSVTPILMPLFFSHTYMEGNAAVQEFSQIINSLAYNYSISIIVINDMVSNRAGKGPHCPYTTIEGRKPALGITWNNVSKIRIFLRKQDSDGSIKARVVKNPRLFSAISKEITLKVTDKGVVDVD